jgi:hypothetical protein
MRILFDHNIPLPVRRLLRSCAVETAGERGWQRLFSAGAFPRAIQICESRQRWEWLCIRVVGRCNFLRSVDNEGEVFVKD